MILIWLNRIFYRLFLRRKNRLLFLRAVQISFDYSTKDAYKYCSFEKVVKRAKKHKDCHFIIQSCYNGIHYPVIDLDNSSQLTKCLTEIEKHYIPYVLIQSSLNHYWVILDHGSKNFYEANTILDQIGAFGDKKYYQMAFSLKRYCIRAFYEKHDVSRLPSVVDTNNIPILKETEFDGIPKSTATGAWRLSYHQKRCRQLAHYSDNFSKFVQDLRNYYTNKCQLVSNLLTF